MLSDEHEALLLDSAGLAMHGARASVALHSNGPGVLRHRPLESLKMCLCDLWRSVCVVDFAWSGAALCLSISPLQSESSARFLGSVLREVSVNSVLRSGVVSAEASANAYCI